MKKVILLIGIFSAFAMAQIGPQDEFLQESARVFVTGKDLPAITIENILFDTQNRPVVVSSAGQFVFSGDSWRPNTKKIPISLESIEPPSLAQGGKVFARVVYDGRIFIGAGKGLFVKDKNRNDWQRVLPGDSRYSWNPTGVKVLVVDSENRLWFGADQGVGCLKQNDWQLFTGKEGLPYDHFTCAAAGSGGSVWFGTEKGVVRTNGSEFFYRFSRRWLADDLVRDIAVDTDGNAWIATANGVSKISFTPMTLEEKAARFNEQVETRHNRMGYICQNHLQEQFNVDSWQPAISDNDGMYTAMYGASMAFRYAVTKDPEAKKLAVRSLKACKWLVDITHEKGFPARVIIPVDWPEPVNDIYNHEYNMRSQAGDPFWKDILPRFVLSKDKKYLWKCDTSSDELAGHYFFYGVYYDLVAETEEEKAEVRQVVADVTDHLVRNGFLLRDHDGKPTRWGDFSPEFMNSIWGWDQRGLNSMMMLSFLNVARHVTGDDKYEETAQMLRDKHQYHINAMQSKMFFPPLDVVPWDNNLCLMSMYGLFKYEQDPELLMMYRESLDNAWLHISLQKNAYWNMLYGALIQRFNKMVDDGVYESGKIFPEAG
ncbi:MAG: hypothetical protein E4H13_09280, partial [Calditrichales bacterium]